MRITEGHKIQDIGHKPEGINTKFTKLVLG